jgi:hypothetical protein
MKNERVFLTAMILLLCAATFAQTEKGNFFIGLTSRYTLSPMDLNTNMPDMMTLGFSSISFKSDLGEEKGIIKINGFNLNPKIGYFAANNLLLGLDTGLGISSYSVKNEGLVEKDIGTYLSTGPFARYFYPMEKIMLFAEAFMGIGTMKTEYVSDGSDSEYKSGVTSIYAGAGFVTKLGTKAGFELSFNYMSNTLKDKQNNADNAKVIIETLGMKFGLVVFLGAD